MYAVMRGPGMNFWFYFLLLPLLLGVLLTALAVGSRQARWIFVDVHQKPGERPERIFLGFPLPLKLTAWFLRIFGPMIPSCAGPMWTKSSRSSRPVLPVMNPSSSTWMRAKAANGSGFISARNHRHSAQVLSSGKRLATSATCGTFLSVSNLFSS